MATVQAENDRGDRTESASTTLKRRGLIAGAAALVAGIAAKQTSQPVAADTGDNHFFAYGSTGTGFETWTGFFDIGVRGTGSTAGVIGSGDRFNSPSGSGIGVQGIGGTLGPTGAGATGVQGNGTGVYPGVYGIGGSGGGYGVVGTGNNGLAGVVGGGGGAGAPGVLGNGGGGNSDGVQGHGTGNFSGTSGFGADGASGTGAYGQGGAPNGPGVRGYGAGTGPGVYGNGANGVYGNATDPSGSGVWGHHYGGGNGVYGDSNNGRGVFGFTNAGYGVLGASPALYGVVGTSSTSVGVVGYLSGAGSETSTSAAVVGTGTKGPGVQGQSPGGHGLVGTTDATDGHAGLVGNANKAGGIGLMGIAPGYGTASVGQAGIFYGNVKIYGGTLSAPVHSAEVKHAGDNSYRLLYSEGATEAWLADYGEAKLTNGSADVKLDADFAALIETSGYQVFLTEYGDHNNLFVATRSGSGFVVQAKEPATAAGVKAPTKAANSAFGYRVVGRRKDITAERLAKVAAPAAVDRPIAMTIAATAVAKVPEVTAPPEMQPQPTPPIAAPPPAAGVNLATPTTKPATTKP